MKTVPGDININATELDSPGLSSLSADRTVARIAVRPEGNIVAAAGGRRSVTACRRVSDNESPSQ